jgi:hypothetical protein
MSNLVRRSELADDERPRELLVETRTTGEALRTGQ